MTTYRNYEDKDWQAICQIHDRARPDELKGSCDPCGFIPIEQDKEVEDLKRSKKFVACEGETVVGFVGVDEDYLAWLYVDPAHYGKGIGRELLRISESARSANAHGPLSLMETKPPLNFMKVKVFRKPVASMAKTTATQSLASK